MKIDLFTVGMIGLNLFCKSEKRRIDIMMMKNPQDAKDLIQNMVDCAEITEGIKALFLKMLRNTEDITITLVEVKTEIANMIIGQ